MIKYGWLPTKGISGASSSTFCESGQQQVYFASDFYKGPVCSHTPKRSVECVHVNIRSSRRSGISVASSPVHALDVYRDLDPTLSCLVNVILTSGYTLLVVFTFVLKYTAKPHKYGSGDSVFCIPYTGRWLRRVRAYLKRTTGRRTT